MNLNYIIIGLSKNIFLSDNNRSIINQKQKVLKGFRLLLTSSFFLKANTKSEMLRQSYMIFSFKKWKINRKIGNKNTLRGRL